ncbi:PadR family transcriptional regulator [Actinopolymorpha rutila]|uniref:DNA-binding PadR family transcriptional regulator n=1 Tax=Actinopolymorpha rutila TaxID=446787 RepID=A0A852Z3G8_9ACTN|nr:PadR family transcriptional regulator [Actinopolymorpha rutila]NYH87524.1 DNA-binding PadR family transcriptional regulator [Actinopolymorpha rutila]
MARRGGVLELAVLGLLHEAPMHGYELRKRLNARFGWGRALSYGSLYPCLKSLLARDCVSEDSSATDVGDRTSTGTAARRRARIVYRLTPAGEQLLTELLAEGGPSAWDDDNFGVRLAFFARTDAAVRLRILEGRRRRLEERLDRTRAQLHRTQERLDTYAVELQRHGVESVEREVHWLSDLIASERVGRPAAKELPDRPEPADRHADDHHPEDRHPEQRHTQDH